MPMFYYKAKSRDASTVFGQLAADGKAEAVEKVSALGLLPIMVTEESGRRSLERGFNRNFKVKGKTLYLFSRQLYSLIKSGIPILRALEIIALQQKDRSFREVISTLRLSVQQGQALSVSLGEYPRIFSALYVSMIKAGEESGTLKDVLADLAAYQRNQDEISSKIRTALAYPLLMGLFGVGTVFFILTYVMPQIVKLFDNIEQALPLPTVIVMQISSWLTDGRVFFGLVIGLLIAVIALQNFFKSKAGRTLASVVVLKIPFLGEFFLKVDLGRFSRTLELLLKSGVSIVPAIKLAIPVAGNELVRQELTRCHDDLVAGKSLGDSLKNSAVIPDTVGYLVSIGEESGSLSQTLNDVADNYEQETQETIKTAMTLFEPLMIVLVGGVVGFIIIAMLLPIFQMDIMAR